MGQKKHFVESTVNLCFMFLCFSHKPTVNTGAVQRNVPVRVYCLRQARAWTLVAAAAFLSDIFIICCNALNSCSYCAHTPLQLFSGFSGRL